MTNQEEFISSTTTDKSRYLESWEFHIKELSSIGYASGKLSRVEEIQKELNEILSLAAERDFK